jgi:hypothetical protein
MKDFVVELIVWVSIAMLTAWLFRMFGASEYTVGFISAISAVTFTRTLFEK